MSAREFVSGVMNLTLNKDIAGTPIGIQFVDAGIPSIEIGDGTTFGNTWNLYKSDCGDWAEKYEQNIAQITNTLEERKFNEIITWSNPAVQIETNLSGVVNQMFEFGFDGWYFNAMPFSNSIGSAYRFNTIISTPSRIVFKITSVPRSEHV